MDVSWRVPALFNNDRAALRLTRLVRRYLGRNLFDAVYGAPMTAWSGGRSSLISERLEEEPLRRYFEAYRDEGIRCSLTLTRMNPNKEDFSDPYCNLLLDMLDEYDGEAIVFNDDLAAYIRQTHPGIPLVASNIKPATDFVKGWPGCSDEYEYYMRLLEYYDRIVIRSEAALNGDMRERLRNIADRCEIIVNPRCVPDCPRCLEHYQNIEKAIEDINHKAGCYYSNDDQRVYSMALDHEQIREFASEGFTHYKIEGRNVPSGIFVKYCMNFILEKEKKAEIQNAMDNRDVIELVMLLTKNEDRETRVQIPQ
jgi:hypothetical protein